MQTYALAIAWTWEYDEDFIEGIVRESGKQRLSTYLIQPQNVQDTLHAIAGGSLRFNVLYDRASDDDEDFLPLVRAMESIGAPVVNPHAHVELARDKATMHLEFISHGISVPYTIIVSPYNQQKEPALKLSELEGLGRPFIIKPANTTGGGLGVVVGAETLKEIIDTRQHHKDDKYLLQETIIPKMLDGRRAWFRVIYAFGEIIPCWWDDRTHVYEEVTATDTSAYSLQGLYDIMARIRDICRLDFFSSEIAMTEEGKLVAVDYVNEICDMRLQSKSVDGVPDAIVARIQALLVRRVSALVGDH